MNQVPVLEYHRPRPTPDELRRVDHLAETLAEAFPLLRETPVPLIGQGALDSAPRLVFEDASNIREPELLHDTTSFLDRARLRAGDGDLVICPNPVPPAYEEYCRDYLGLGEVEWLHPVGTGNKRHVVRFLRSDGTGYARVRQWVQDRRQVVIDSYMASDDVWDLARSLRQETGSEVYVCGSPPRVTDWVNNKAYFTKVIWELFGKNATPRTLISEELGEIANAIKTLLSEAERIIVKLPDSAGGAGNISLKSEDIQEMSDGEFRERLERALKEKRWLPGIPVLVSPWLTQIMASPSVQTWIPLPGEDPIVEGVFEQKVVGWQGEFRGCRPARFPPHLSRRLVDNGWLLALLFQRLGYLGRCSFDFILSGSEMDTATSYFLECNGRWGGTSLPMTMLNRIFGDWKSLSYTVSVCGQEGLGRLSFSEIVRAHGNRIFDRRDDRGFLILLNPTRLDLGLGLEVLAIGRSIAQAEQRLNRARQLLEWISQERVTIWK